MTVEARTLDVLVVSTAQAGIALGKVRSIAIKNTPFFVSG